MIIAHAASTLITAVPTAPPGSDGMHCSKSPESINDPLPGPGGSVDSIVGIAKVIKDHQVVGFIYRTASGQFFAQALPTMPYDDQVQAGVVVANKAALNHPHGILYSSLKPIDKYPWRDLSLLPCR